MANPQKENGSTDIANELLEAIYSMNFNGTEFAIILCVLRYTYGFHRKEHNLSINFISKATKKHKINVATTINNLIEKKVLIETKKPTFCNPREIGINKDYSNWKDIELVKRLTVSNKTNTTVSELTNRGVSELTNQETKNEETKKETKNIYIAFGEFKRVKLTEKEYQKLCDDFTKEIVDNKIREVDEYVEINNNKNKYKNFYLVVRKAIKEKWFENKQENKKSYKEQKFDEQIKMINDYFDRKE